MPPNTAAVNALMPGMNPIRKLTCLNINAYSTPAAPASAPPIMNVMTMMRSTSMPIRAAVCLSSATARIALPVRVF